MSSRPQSLARKIFILLFALQIFQLGNYRSVTALLLQCPLHQMHLQKIIGFRPPLEYLHEHNLIYAPPFTTVKQKHDRPTVSAICWRICNEDPDCIAYVHLLDTDECYGYSYFERSKRYQTIGGDLPLVADTEAIFYEKICLKVPETCRNRLWTLTKIPGTSLMFQGVKTVPTLVTRRECAEKCLFESEFDCLSASFSPSYRNNRERFNQQMPVMQQHQNQYQQQQQRVTLGRCILSNKDKMIQPDAFRTAPYESEYMENQCYERKSSIEYDHCSYELYANSSFIYAETRYEGLTQKECQAYCTRESRFFCQGVSYYYEKDLSSTECLLHSEDIISMGPRSLKLRERSTYMRRVKCLDVQVLCTRDEMIIKYTPKDWFRGKMYVSLHSKDCMVHGNGTATTLLRLSIGSEVKENRCGILRAFEVTSNYQRTFISALVVIQNNANVQTQGDRLIKVGCIMSNTTRLYPVDQHNVVGEDDDQIGEEVPNAIALESSLDFSHNILPNEGSLHFNTSDVQPLPKISLQIVDISHQHETNDVQIGQNLELQIIAEYPDYPFGANYQNELPPLPEFRATSLIAKTQDNQNYVQLIDENGCPTDVTVFPPLERTRTSRQNILRARFHAFKFAGTSMVTFDVKIHLCTQQQCPPNNCLQRMMATQGRRRRRAATMDVKSAEQQLPFKVQNPIYISTVLDVSEAPEVSAYSEDSKMNGNSSQSVTNASQLDSLDTGLPLNYNLHVRGPDMTNTNSLIYGERGVLLIAGIDDQLHLDSVCLNQSLLIALFIFWLMFQVAVLFTCLMIIQKYKRLVALEEERRKIHENFDYLDARRVHWADQGGYTL